MSLETTTQEQEIIQAAWDVFQYWTGSRDEDYFRRAYLGCYDSREAFGVELAERLGIGARLARLPEWTRAYLRIDGAAVARDFEASGHFHLIEAPGEQGTFVFDAYEEPAE